MKIKMDFRINRKLNLEVIPYFPTLILEGKLMERKNIEIPIRIIPRMIKKPFMTTNMILKIIKILIMAGNAMRVKKSGERII